MNYLDFAQKHHLPSEQETADKYDVWKYFSYIEQVTGKDEQYIRLISLSKDFILGFMKLSDEKKYAFCTGLYQETKASQDNGEIFTLEMDKNSNSTFLVTLVEFTSYHVLHIEKR